MASNYLIDQQVSQFLRVVAANKDDAKVNGMITGGMRAVEGLPYQFMDTVDRRISGTSIGRKYGEKIYSRLPLLFLTPCEPLFMDDFTSAQRSEGVVDLLTSGLGQTVDGMLDTLTGTSGKYYSVDFAYDTYYKYLNTMLNVVSKFIFGNDAFNIKINGKSLATYNYADDASNEFMTFFEGKENVVFYVDGFTSVDETFSNQQGESSLASTINQYSQTANEIRFLFGSKGNVVAELLNSGGTVTESITSSLEGLAGTLAGGIVGSLSSNGVNSVLNGGKIIFPKIWSDSSFDKSYSFTIKLRSPDHDNLSIFLNVLKPYCKLLSMVLPRQVNTKDPNAYGAPFLVKAYVKGMVNVEMGMISSMSVTKGESCCWNDDGLPTQIDINITIDDMYSSLMMSNSEANVFETANNTSYMDFLGNMAGLNMGQMAVGRRLKMVPFLMQERLTQFIPNTVMGFEKQISRGIGTLYNTL